VTINGVIVRIILFGQIQYRFFNHVIDGYNFAHKFIISIKVNVICT